MAAAGSAMERISVSKAAEVTAALEPLPTSGPPPRPTSEKATAPISAATRAPLPIRSVSALTPDSSAGPKASAVTSGLVVVEISPSGSPSLRMPSAALV